MVETVTAAEMRAIEKAAMASGAVTGLELMERAGRAVVGAILSQWPDLATAPARAAILCGPGNNGGDGFVVARLLRQRGWEADVFLFGEADRLPPDARANFDRWRGMGETAPYFDAGAKVFEAVAAGVRPCDLIVDALFGIGLTRPVEGIGAFARATRAGRPVVAIDLPSGVETDSGRILRGSGAAPGGDVRADLTVTFHRRKPCHVRGAGAAACGKVVLADIGLEPWDGARAMSDG